MNSNEAEMAIDNRNNQASDLNVYYHFLGEMISPLCDQNAGNQASFVRKKFILSDMASPITLYISALGLYRAFINNKQVGDDLLTPGWTCYDDRIAYQQYDITSLLQVGENTIEIWLGDGWYRGRLMWEESAVTNCWGNDIGAIADITQSDFLLLKTDDTWVAGLLPITAQGIYLGEDFDARIKKTESADVRILDFNNKLLVPHEIGGVKELSPLYPQQKWRDKNCRTLYDFGQNTAGYIRFRVKGKSGANIRIEHAEVLGKNQYFDNRNYRSARAEIIYTLNGCGEEEYAPSFTFMGFRYARVTITGEAELTHIEMVPISSVPDVKGGFQCGEEAINRLVLNTIWSQRSNFIEVPTDCPQRDERLGWTGDAQVFANTACWLADSQYFLKKFLRDVIKDQRDNGAISYFSPDTTRVRPEIVSGDWAGSTGWGDCITLIPWQIYLHYADEEVLVECLPAMLKWLDYLWNISNGPIIKPPPEWGAHGFSFGDWLQPIGDNRKPRPTIADDCAATIYHYISTDITQKIAQILGKTEIEQQLYERANIIRDAFINEYFSPSGRIAHNDQTSWAFAFLYNLVPAEHYKNAKEYFRKSIIDTNGVIGTGFIGTPVLLPALTKLKMYDLAENLILNRDVPGWLYQVEQGATSIWERWDAIEPDGEIYSPDMNSYNHYAYGAVCEWLFESIAGIAPSKTQPGFKEIMIDPIILPALNPVSAWHDCPYGQITAHWQINNNKVTYSLEIPPNTTGRLMPNTQYNNYTHNGEKILIPTDGHILPAGKHIITFYLNE